MVARTAVLTNSRSKAERPEPCFLPCLTPASHFHSPAALVSRQLARYTKEGFLHLGALGTTTLLPDTRCLVDNSKSRLPQLLDCDKVKSSLYKRWNFIQNGAIMNKGTGHCLEVENRGLAGIDLILRSCTGQRWTIKNSIK
nr:polypeptide N-acetylgalactosaminyltransferase 17-like [Gorilla gorilla gorilla]